MPRIIAEPIVITQVNYYKAVGLNTEYDSDDPGQARGAIKLKRGYRNDQGVVTLVNYEFVQLTPQELAEELSELTSGDSLYDELQARMYAICLAKGAIPQESTEI